VSDAPARNPDHGVYLWRYLLVLLFTLVGVAAFSFWANPYRLFSPTFESAWNRIKPRPESNITTVKLLNAASAAPRALILGNSRAEIGFDPEHPGWGVLRGRVYNLAIPGAGIETVRDQFRALLDRVDVDTVVFAVDFQDFVLNAGRVSGESRDLDIDALRRKERVSALLTLTGARDSIRTIQASRTAYPASLRHDGFNPLFDYVPIARRDGYDVMFRQRLSETAANYLRGRKGLFPPGESDSSEFQAFRDVLRMARDHGIRLVVVTYPYHAQYYALFRELGLWSDFEQWKRLLLESVEENVAAGAVTVADHGFCDFAAVSAPATSVLEPTDASGASHWYWEAGHFKKALGDRLLAQLLDGGEQPDRDFGACLGSDTIDEWLLAQQQRLQEFAFADADALEQVRTALSRAHAATR
jgi:hypothetical protein